MNSLIFQKNISLAQFNSWKVGGAADYYCTPTNVEELMSALQWARDKNIPTTVLSGGTNVLISDDGVEGLVIHLRKFSGLETSVADGRLHLVALAGTAKSELLKCFLKFKLAPCIFLAGLPGDVGAGVVMNAGIGESLTPREFVEITDWIEILREDDGAFKVIRLAREDLRWSYRHCDGWQPGVIVRVGMSWPDLPELAILERTKQMNQNRLKKQPLEWPSCGSVFRNPDGFKSGQLIDELGLRGFRIGGAEVSEKHANFIINREHATARELHDVIEHVKKAVVDAYGITLRTEVVYLGRWP
jgi:UDP-N-acetylmuramate dehydrogenase